VLDERQLYCISDGSMGNILSRRRRKRKYQMASSHLGYVGGPTYSVGGHQLFAAKGVFWYIQVRNRRHDAGFLPLRYLASDRCL